MPAMTSHTLPVGTRLQQGKYTVDKVLGHGGFGITYLATDTALRRRVAIKELFPRGCVRQGSSVVLPTPPARLNAKDFDRAKERFVKEARTVARFDHPGIVRVYTEFRENNTAYMVMEYLQGRTLAELLEANGGGLSEPEAVRYVKAIGQALKEVHEASVLHRDVKPENVLVTDEGRTVVVDFGAAREFTADVTESIEVVLTPGYAPLEQYGSRARAGVYTDVYALGATLYRLLTGKVPVAAPDRYSGIALKGPDQVNAQVSEKVSKAVMKSMEADAPDRYQSMDDFLDALANREPPRPPPAAPTLTRGDGSCRATWANVSGATGYDLRWRQREAWTHVPNVVSPRTIAPLVDRARVDVQVRATNGTGASDWSPIGCSDGTSCRVAHPGMMKRIVFGVALLAVIMIGVWWIGTGREREGEPPSREDPAPSALPEERGDEPVVPSYPRIRSLVRLEPSDLWTRADSVTWRITFTDAVTNVDQGDFDIIGIRPSRLTVSKVGELGDVYDITLGSHSLADHNGRLTLGLSPSSYIKNLAGNRLLNINAVGVYEASFVVDNIAPTVSFHPESRRIDDAGANLTMTFSEAVYSDSSRKAFMASTLADLIDLRAENESGADIPFTATNDNDNDTVTIDPTGTLPIRTWVRVMSSYYDTVGNEGHRATANFTVEPIGPTVTIAGVPETDSGAFMATFTFSEAVTGFKASDVAVTNGTASALTEAQAGRQWHVRITPTGDYSVSLPADRVTDLAGNGNRTSTSHNGSYGTDTTDPRLISIVRQNPSSSPTRADSMTWRVTFSEDVQHFKISSVNLLDQSDQVIRRSADRVSAVGGSESVYDVTFSDGVLANYSGRMKLNFQLRSDDNAYSVNVQDKATRALLCCSTLGADENTFDMDNAAPWVESIVRSNPGREHTNDDEVAWTVTFSEPVRNLSGGDFAISGTDAAITVTPEGSGSRTWNVIASGGNLASLNGRITLSFSDTRNIEDAAGNVLADTAPTGADENAFVIDNISPGLVSIDRRSPNEAPANAEAVQWRLTFSEGMVGVDATDFAIQGATLSLSSADSKAVYDLSVSGIDLASVRGIVSLHFKSDGDITDLAGNALSAPRPPATLPLPSS